MKEYPQHIEDMMYGYYINLSEKDKRHYSAVEAAKLGHGGINYISELFGCCRQTVSTGIQELTANDSIEHSDRVRRKGGGRMSTDSKFENIDEIFLKGN